MSALTYEDVNEKKQLEQTVVYIWWLRVLAHDDRRICNTKAYRFTPQTAETMASLSSCSNLSSALKEKIPFSVCILQPY